MSAVALALAISLRSVRSVEIDHVPNRLQFRSALTPAELDARAPIRVETQRAEAIGAILRAIEATKAERDDHRADLRYAVRLRGSHGRVVTLYLDAFGTRGWVAGRAVRFDSDAIKRAVVALAPVLRT
jgi:hypothetical protein